MNQKYKTYRKDGLVPEYTDLKTLVGGTGFDIKYDDYIWCRDTGLHDKNGKDVYEDDLITFQLYSEWSNTWDQRNERVIWSMDRWTTDQTNYDLSMPSQYFEVIGNIYETEDY